MSKNILMRSVSILSCILVSATSTYSQVNISESSYPARTDWSESTGSLNISSFVFQDRNRSGTYDIGDRAFSGIFVALGKDNAPVSGVRTNANGFANFRSAVNNPDVPLSETGVYDFVVVPPPGWFVSTQNAEQTRELIEIPGSTAGVGLVEMPHPVGLVPYTYVRGTVPDAIAGTLDVIQNDKIIANTEIQEDGQFLVPLEPGSYNLEFGDETRTLRVKYYPIDIGTFAALEATPDPKYVLSFDDLATRGLQKIPNGYGGLNWFNLNALRSDFSSGSVGYQNGVMSGETIVYTSSGHPTEISREGGFDFRSVMLTLAWSQAEGETAIFEYYRDRELVLVDSVRVSALSTIEYIPMMMNIDRVVIRSEHYWQLVLDDLVVSFMDD